ncbi:MAG: TRAP transporter large permease subunit [Deltaproteobacteria bacterium]|nr:TRAP transporter large permease subunit [Deltaproteobacteria bacterium]
MTIGMITLTIWSALLALLLTGFPVAFCMLSVAVVGYIFFISPQALYTIFPVVFRNLTTDIYVAIPLFIFMAAVFQVSGIGDRMYGTMYKWMAGLRGGLAIGTVVICTVIAAMTGLGGTGTVTMGLLAYPEMRKRGYEKRMAIGCIPAGGALGPLIPPSIPMILVGNLSGVSVGKLFMAGVFPGLICSFFFMLYIAIKCFFSPSLGPPIPPAERANWNEKFVSLGGTLAPILLILLVLGGIYTGACTPSEAGGVGAAGALICAAIYRNFNRKNLWWAVMTTMRVNAMVMWLVIGGASFSSLCGITGVTHFVRDILVALPIGPIGILTAMLTILFVMGMFIENASIIMICLPIMMPVALNLGFDPLWFGLVFTMVVIIGMITPVFGYNLFYFRGLGHADVNMMDIYLAILPYIPLMLASLALCIIFPEIVLWLPNRMIK